MSAVTLGNPSHFLLTNGVPLDLVQVVQKYSGQQFPFKIIKNIGKGRSGFVRLAHDLETWMNVALKILGSEAFDHVDELPRSIREVLALSQLRHPNIIQLYRTVEFNGFLLVSTEFVERGELFDFVKEHGALHEDVGCFFAVQIIHALAYCHGLGLIHRDIKPENVLLASDFSVRLCDFGFCNMISATQRVLATPCGSPVYAAPEVFRNEPYVEKVDMWSLGVLLYVIHAAKMPWGTGNDRAQRRNILSGTFDPQPIAHCSDAFKDLIRRLISVDPACRPSSGEVLAHPWFTCRQGRPMPAYLSDLIAAEQLGAAALQQQHLSQQLHDLQLAQQQAHQQALQQASNPGGGHRRRRSGSSQSGGGGGGSGMWAPSPVPGQGDSGPASDRERPVSDRQASDRDRPISDRQASDRDRPISDRQASDRDRPISDRQTSDRDRPISDRSPTSIRATVPSPPVAHRNAHQANNAYNNNQAGGGTVRIARRTSFGELIQLARLETNEEQGGVHSPPTRSPAPPRLPPIREHDHPDQN